MSASFEQKALKEFANIRKELADLKIGLSETTKAVELNREAIEVNREQIAVNTQKLDAHETRFMHMDIMIMDIYSILRNHDRQFEKLHEGQRHILNVIDSFLGEIRRQSTEITALGSARERHEGRIERLEAHTGLAA